MFSNNSISSVQNSASTPIARPLFKLLFFYFIHNRQSWYGIFLSPIIQLVFFYFVFYKVGSLEKSFFGSYALVGIFGASFIALGNVLVRWKRSVLFRRLEITPIKTWQLMSAMIFFYMIIGLLSSGLIVVFLTLLLMFRPPSNLTLSSFWADISASQAGILVLALVSFAVCCNLLVFTIGYLLPPKPAEGVIIILFFLMLFFGGLSFPLNIIDQQAFTFLLSMCFPIKYCLYLMNYGINYQGRNGNHWWEVGSRYLLQHPWLPVLILVCFLLLSLWFIFYSRNKKHATNIRS